VLCASTGKGEQVPARLQYPQHLAPYIDRRNDLVPRLAHKRQPIRRIRHYRVNATRLQPRQHIQTITRVYHRYTTLLQQNHTTTSTQCQHAIGNQHVHKAFRKMEAAARGIYRGPRRAGAGGCGQTSAAGRPKFHPRTSDQSHRNSIHPAQK